MEDNELRAYFARIDEQFAEVHNRITTEIGNVGVEINRHTTEIGNLGVEVNRNTTEIRHLGVEIEGLRSAMQLNNDMIHAVDEKLESFRTETKDNFKSVHDVIGTSHAQLISRIRKLEKAS
ncbi:MAG TPA: hypothetical protein VJZ76_12075 [Thermoanaerobaculia bacterium]|nr:hypothetical protein [Thermoanaerobaculia bacterium]